MISAKGTSSRSTKLVHGGVRYLQHGDVALVFEALRERGRMKANAPAPGQGPGVRDLELPLGGTIFSISAGLAFYDLLSLGFGYGRSRFISAAKTARCLPVSVKRGLKGGIVYHDGQFDDSRMAVNLAQTVPSMAAPVESCSCRRDYAR